MKRIIMLLMALAMTLPCALRSVAQDAFGKISLEPYIDPGAGLDAPTQKLLTTKLGQMVTATGATGGFDKRFVLATHINILDESTTATIPQKTSMKVSFTFYVGDAEDGKLYATHEMQTTGVGDSREDALRAAIRKINPRNPQLLTVIDQGKESIVAWYEANAAAIITQARTLMQQTSYEEATYKLAGIPSVCSRFEQAQDMLAECGRAIVTAEANKLLLEAQSIWAANPNEEGAQAVSEVLARVVPVNATIKAKADKLNNEIAAQLKQQRQQELQLERERIAASERVKKAALNAAASIAKSYYSQRVVVYRGYWW